MRELYKFKQAKFSNTFMRFYTTLIFFVFLTFSLSAQVFKTKNIKLEKIVLSNNFELVGAIDTTESLPIYEQLLIKHNQKAVYFDSSTYYFFESHSYPMLLSTGPNSFELLLETDGRPQANGLLHFKIRNDSVIQVDKLPIFISAAANLDNDAAPEYAGCIGYPESADTYIPYSPIVYYELHPDGIKVDSTLTETRNKLIYGAFQGFDYREDLHSPINRLSAYDAEIKRIKEAK